MVCLVFAPLLGAAWANVQEESRESIAFYYAGHVPVDELSMFDKVVLEPSNVSNHELEVLEQRGSQVFAYVSIGEAQRGEVWVEDLPPAWKLGQNEAWNSIVMDLSNKQWQSFILEKLVAGLAEKPYAGLFLDTLDSFHLVAKTPQEFQRQKQGLIQIIRQIHTRFPKLKLLLNRGFDVMDDLHTMVDGVAAESLFQSWDASTKTYGLVSEVDRNWLMKKLTAIKESYHLPVYVIDYVPANKSELARQTAKKIAALGFTPWVSTPALNTLGVSRLEIMPRKVMVLYDSKRTTLADSQAHRYLASPLEYMGYVVEYKDVRQSLPEFPLSGRYAGIITWFASGTVDIPLKNKQWLKQQVGRDLPVVFINSPGFVLDTSFLKRLGLRSVTSKIEMPVTIVKNDEVTRMEVKLRALARSLIPIVATTPDVQVHGSIEGSNHVRMDSVLTAAWGGMALAPYVLEARLDGNAFWRLNIFKFLEKALHVEAMPLFDVTTENGRRLLMTHIDGDGIASYADMPGNHLAIQVVYDEILRKYPWPATVSVITSEIETDGLFPRRALKMQSIARDIFSLKHVEIASHSYSHPFDWAHASTDKDAHLHIPGYSYSLEKEIIGSIDFINKHLAPKDKKAKVFLWSGDALPGEKALKLVESIGLKNMNGGNTLASRAHPSLTNVSSMVRPIGDQLQVYAPVMNENVYTKNWTKPLYGFERVIETFRFTDMPRRLKPIDIYYHFYSGSEYGSLRALKKVYDWSLKQQVLPVWVSEYVEKVEAYQHATMAKRLDGAWVFRSPEALRTVRIDKGMGWPNLQQSEGISGVRSLPQGRYVHLSGLNKGLYTLKLQQTKTSQPYLLDANAILKKWSVKDNTIHFRLKGHIPIQFSLNKKCGLTLGKRDIQPEKGAGFYRYQLKTTDTGHAILRC